MTTIWVFPIELLPSDRKSCLLFLAEYLVCRSRRGVGSITIERWKGCIARLSHKHMLRKDLIIVTLVRNDESYDSGVKP